MSTFLKNKAFCVLPFIEKFQALDGKDYLCCYSNRITLNNDIVKLSSKILNGEQIPHCKKCYDLDVQRIVSPRLRESSRWLKDPEIVSYLTNWTPESEQKTFFYDLRFDNKCNLACISCNAMSSSLIAKELNVTVPKYKLNFNVNDCLTAKKIYLAGGEPLIIDEFIDLIFKIADQDEQPELAINTNLTIITPKLKSALSRIKNLTLTVSVDSFGRVNEYHRWPMKWSKFMNNLLYARNNLDCTIQLNSVVDAVTVINLAKLVEIEHLTDQWSLSVLTSPGALVVNNLPEKEKENIIQQFVNIKKSKFYSIDINFKSKVDGIIAQISNPGDPYLLSNYIAEIDQRRNINHITYLGINLI
jgi:MoaA/NifB/PqqE/SkfB family radical SAM enzyme